MSEPKLYPQDNLNECEHQHPRHACVVCQAQDDSKLTPHSDVANEPCPGCGEEHVCGVQSVVAQQKARIEELETGRESWFATLQRFAALAGKGE